MLLSMSLDFISIIPARGGSKGIPRKNIRLLNNVPLVEWSIKAALKSQTINKIILSSDDDEILNIGKKFDVYCHKRDKMYSNDDSSTQDFLENLIAQLIKNKIIYEDSVIVLMEPTSPFRPIGLVDKCANILKKENYKTVATCTQLERNPYNIFTINNQSAKRLFEIDRNPYLQRQKMNSLKRINGSLYITYARDIMRGKIINYPLYLFEMSQELSINIDSYYDLNQAELLSKKYVHFIQS